MKISSIKDIINKLKEYGFQPDLSLILEVFEIAYGMEWLAEYMSDHYEEFKYYLENTIKTKNFCTFP